MIFLSDTCVRNFEFKRNKWNVNTQIKQINTGFSDLKMLSEKIHTIRVSVFYYSLQKVFGKALNFVYL